MAKEEREVGTDVSVEWPWPRVPVGLAHCFSMPRVTAEMRQEISRLILGPNENLVAKRIASLTDEEGRRLAGPTKRGLK